MPRCPTARRTGSFRAYRDRPLSRLIGPLALLSPGGDSPNERRDHDRQVELAHDRLQAGRDTRRRRDGNRSEEHTSELQSLRHLVCRLLLEKKKKTLNKKQKRYKKIKIKTTIQSN